MATQVERNRAYRLRQRQRLAELETQTRNVTPAVECNVTPRNVTPMEDRNITELKGQVVKLKDGLAEAMAKVAERNERIKELEAEVVMLRSMAVTHAPEPEPEPEEPEPEERVEEGNGDPMGGHWNEFGAYIVP